MGEVLGPRGYPGDNVPASLLAALAVLYARALASASVKRCSLPVCCGLSVRRWGTECSRHAPATATRIHHQAATQRAWRDREHLKSERGKDPA